MEFGICRWAADVARLAMGCGKGRWPRKVYDHISNGSAQQNHNNHIADPPHHAATANVVAREGRKKAPEVRETRHVLPRPAWLGRRQRLEPKAFEKVANRIPNRRTRAVARMRRGDPKCRRHKTTYRILNEELGWLQADRRRYWGSAARGTA